MVRVAGAVLLAAAEAAAHGVMNQPPSRNAGVHATAATVGGCPAGACMFFNQGCTIGCKCNEDNTHLVERLCNSSLQPTLNDPQYRTFNRHPAPAGADTCAGPAARNASLPHGECVLVLGAPGPYVRADCSNPDRPVLCKYPEASCGGEAHCVALGDQCTVLPVTSETGVCSNGVMEYKYWYETLGDWTRYHPWRAPGNARLLDSCGLAGGSTKDNLAAGGMGNMTVAGKQGFPGSQLPPVQEKTVWKAGSTQEVRWGMFVNHGGGYQYRLCPKGEPLTEDCFQKTPLAFVGDRSWLVWANGHRAEIPATRVTEGTTPPGSAWTMNPIPACNSTSGGFQGAGCEAPQFPPPPGCNDTCWGYQRCSPMLPEEGPCNLVVMPDVADLVRVPRVPAGDYVVSWRWDCEQTSQVWSGCGDVTVVV